VVRFRQPDESDLLKAANGSSNRASAPTSPHPSVSTWRRFVEGSVDESELPVIEEHLSQCQLCTETLAGLRRTKPKHSALGWLLAAAALLIAFIAFISLPRSRAHIDLDLRQFSPSRGGGVSEAPIVTFPLSEVGLSLTLPVGSRDGQYDVGMFSSDGAEKAQASETARTGNGITTLKVKLDLRHVPAGQYLLGIRYRTALWEYYRVAVK